jgi:hypothetical protein
MGCPAGRGLVRQGALKRKIFLVLFSKKERLPLPLPFA